MNTQTMNRTTADIGERAHKLWLAGLGAVSRTRDQGEKLFAELVSEGTTFERKARKEVKATVARWRKEADSRVNAVRKQTSGQWKRLEKAFDQRVAGVLERLDVPTRDSINRLARQVEKLNREVKGLEASRSRRRRA